MNPKTTISRHRAVVVNRLMTGAVVPLAFATYFWQPVTILAYALDIAIRAYLHFISGVMAHESVHGHLGNTRKTNQWWGRYAMLPTTVPYVTFCLTHRRHHSATNIPELDPDEFLNTPHRWQIPLRAFALPYYWVLWAWRNRQFPRRIRVEYYLNYLAVGLVYMGIGSHVGFSRVFFGLMASATLHSLLLWYCFAIKTHEGYSTGAPETRSHNYDSRFLYWFSCGLSMHRLHHMQPRLPWLQMMNQVQRGVRWKTSTMGFDESSTL